MTRARARIIIGALLAAGLILTAALILRGRAQRPGPTVGATKPPGARNLGAALPAWARDPDAEPGTLAGVVKAPDGAPVEGAWVSLVPEVDSGPMDIRVRPAAVTRSDAAGVFRLATVRPGEYGLTASADGYAGAHRGGIVVLPGSTQEGLELLLEAGGVSLSGRIADAGGGPLPGAELRVFAGLGAASQTRVFQVTADAQGQYRITVPKSMYFVVADADGYAAQSRMVDTNVTRTADFALQPAARLAGRVIERASGAGVAGATVVLEEIDLWWRPAREVHTNAEGRFEVRDLEAGVFRISAQKGRRVVPARDVTVAAADRTTEVELALEAGWAVRGRVVTAGSQREPIAGARIRLATRALALGQAQVRATSAADGSFQIEGVLPGKFAISAETRQHAPSSREVTVHTGRDAEVELELAVEAVIAGQVLDGRGAGVAGANVTAWVPGAPGGVEMGKWAADRTDPRGHFRLGALPAGQARVEAQHNDRGRASWGPEAVAAGETKTVTLTLQPGATVSGTVRWKDGTPAPQVTVLATVPAAMSFVQAKTNEDGTYQVGPLAAGQATIVASRAEGVAAFMEMNPRAQKQMRTLTLEENQRKRGVDLVLDKGGHKLRGVVLAPDDKPVSGATVSAGPMNDPMEAMRASMSRMMGGGQGAQTDEEGRFALDDLTEGPYAVIARHASYPDARVEKVPTDAPEVTVKFAAPAVLAGTATDAEGRPVADFTVSALEATSDEKGGPEKTMKRVTRSTSAMFGGGGKPVHDAQGAFEVGALAAGMYEVVVSTADGRVGRSPPVSVAAGERKTGLSVRLVPGVRLRGRLAEFGSDQPLGGQMVMVMDAHQPVMRTTGADGTFTVEGLQGGQTVMLAVGGPMTGVVPDGREITLPRDRPELDIGTFRLIRSDRPTGGPADAGLRVSEEQGRLVLGPLDPASPAAKEGLKQGDILVQIDGRPLAGLGPNGASYLLSGSAGASVRVAVSSGGVDRTVTLTLASRSGEQEVAAGRREDQRVR